MAKTSTNGEMVGGKDGTSRHARQTEEFAGAISMAQHTRRSNSGSFIRSQSMGNVAIFDEVCSADINVNKGKFEINRMEKHKGLYFAYENGKMKLKGQDMNREVLCAHFQKRAIEIEKDINYDKYYFVAPCHITSDENQIKSHVIENRLFEIRRLLKRVENKIR